MSTTATAIEPRERPILFSGPMVRAILEGRKTQTRRVVRVPESLKRMEADMSTAIPSKAMGVTPCLLIRCADGSQQRLRNPWMWPDPSRLWVRETFGIRTTGNGFGRRGHDQILYRASESEEVMERLGIKWKPAIFLPRALSRITLEISKVRVERLQDITENDVCFEGFDIDPFDDTGAWRADFANGWNAINEKRGFSWLHNPFVWVVGFKRAD